ncbi:MAG: F0F1 ATP synthase subunit A [Thermodesulfobacteriota bacterium]
MDLKDISPDAVVLWSRGPLEINATLVYTWGVMLLMVGGSWLVTRKLSDSERIPRWQNLLEVVVTGVRDQIEEITNQQPGRFLPFLGTLFLFILICNLLTVVPGYVSPTASLSTTAGLAICVFVSVPLFGIRDRGLIGYLRQYVRPNVFMLPFNVMGELSRTLALAVRLFGNLMSGAKIVAILLAVAPFFFPILMRLLGLLTGVIQAYIFAVLAAVYIASAMKARRETATKGEN